MTEHIEPLNIIVVKDAAHLKELLDAATNGVDPFATQGVIQHHIEDPFDKANDYAD